MNKSFKYLVLATVSIALFIAATTDVVTVMATRTGTLRSPTNFFNANQAVLINTIRSVTNGLGGGSGLSTNAVSTIQSNGVSKGTNITILNFVQTGNTFSVVSNALGTVTVTYPTNVSIAGLQAGSSNLTNFAGITTNIVAFLSQLEDGTNSIKYWVTNGFITNYGGFGTNVTFYADPSGFGVSLKVRDRNGIDRFFVLDNSWIRMNLPLYLDQRTNDANLVLALDANLQVVGTNVYAYVTNEIYNATNNIAPFSTNQASMTFTNGININTNGAIVMHQVGQDSATDYARGIISNTPSGLQIGTFRAGTGTTNSMPFRILTDGSERIVVNQSGLTTIAGHLYPASDNNFSLGKTGAGNRWRDIYAYNSINCEGGTVTGVGLTVSGTGNLNLGGSAILSSPGDGRLLIRRGSSPYYLFTHISFGLETSTNVSINVTNGSFKITTGNDLNGLSPIFTSDPINRTNLLGGTTSITNLVADYAQTNYSQTTNLVFYLDLSIPFHRLVITNTATTSITIHTTNRPAADNIVRVSRLKILQNMTNSLPLTFNSSWTNFVGNLPPSALASNVWGVLSIDCDGPSETNVLAGYAVQPY